MKYSVLEESLAGRIIGGNTLYKIVIAVNVSLLFYSIAHGTCVATYPNLK
jgi:hypothetical protein